MPLYNSRNQQKNKRYKHTRTLLLWSLVLASTSWCQAQTIEWLSFEEAIALHKKAPKKILIDVYTDWCGYCKKMERVTYGNATIAALVNTYFYPVKFNAEQKEILNYNGKTYRFVQKGRRGFHEFAVELLNGKMSYPSTVFLGNDASLLDKIPGYLNPQLMEKILVYLAEEKFITQDWDSFDKNFKSKLD
jgi:thioredoxin-related protein